MANTKKENVKEALRTGSFSLITSWQDRNIWHWGAVYEPSDLVMRVCGRPLSAEPFTRYLEEKFSRLYL